MNSTSVDELVEELKRHQDTFDFQRARAKGMSYNVSWHLRNFLKNGRQVSLFGRDFFTPIRDYHYNCKNLFTYTDVDEGAHHHLILEGVFDHRHITSRRPFIIWLIDTLFNDPKNVHCLAGQVILNPKLRELMHASPSAYSLLAAHVIENHDEVSTFYRTRPMLLIPGADTTELRSWEEDMNTYRIKTYGRTYRVEREEYYRINPLLHEGQ